MFLCWTLPLAPSSWRWRLSLMPWLHLKGWACHPRLAPRKQATLGADVTLGHFLPPQKPAFSDPGYATSARPAPKLEDVWQSQRRTLYFTSCSSLIANGWKMQKVLCSAKPSSIGNSWKLLWLCNTHGLAQASAHPGGSASSLTLCPSLLRELRAPQCFTLVYLM